MGYACPVCETPQRDGEHLAHHLAFTAMLHGDDHETWLEERVDDWSSMEPTALAAVVVEDAAEAEYHEVFEDTTDQYEHRQDHDHDPTGHDHHPQLDHSGGPPFDGAHGTDFASGPARNRGAGSTDPETEAIIEEARDLTREMLAEDESPDEGEGRSESGGRDDDGIESGESVDDRSESAAENGADDSP